MTFSELNNLFTTATKENFPADECTVQNENEENVFDSKEKYIGFIIDDRFKHDYRIAVISPYVCVENGNKKFGWVDENGTPLSNLENTVNILHEIVVGFEKLQEYEEDDIIWKYFVSRINSQWE